jgi:signal transduction histidine kinase
VIPNDSESTLHVLVIEDDPDTQANLRDILELDDHRVECAGTLALAAKRNRWDEISVVLLDRKLPDGMAEDFLPRLKELAPQADVIVVTGFSDVEGAITALRRGAADYILKPINPDVLRASLARTVERRKLRLAKERAEERLLQSERLAAIGQMVTGLAHESRNALQRSKACLELLSIDLAENREALDLVARIHRAHDHLHRLYEEVRGYAAPIALQRTAHDLRAIWRDSWEDLEVSRRERSVQFVEEVSDGEFVCPVDRHALEQVFRNILENAIHACPAAGQITVRCTAGRLDRHPAWHITFRDTGPGLTAEQQNRIFEPFFTTKTQGTGLGMAITKRIVEAHGGTISAASNPAGGAEIHITLPRDP